MKPFKFKEFTVQQEKSAMKIGTDAVLLGAWCAVDDYPDTILDVGTGTGVIALMLAQRTDAMTIDAVEIDEAAYEECVDNFEQSSWGDRLFCYYASFQEFVEEIQDEEETFELIVSNPPFYTDEYQTQDEARNKARFTSSLSFEDLLLGVSSILDDKGKFATIVPYKSYEEFVAIALKNKLFLNRQCQVKGNPSSEITRCLLEFSFKESELQTEHFVIEKERHQYTEAYIALTKDFYLKM